MTVFRTKPLPTGPSDGTLIVPEEVVSRTTSALKAFRGESRHEGLVYWIGRWRDDAAYVVGAVSPRCEHGPQFVRIGEVDVGKMMRTARAYRSAIIAQVHSHPGSDTRHSDGDDDLVLMPHHGLFSLVVGNYGDSGFDESLGVHQYQEGTWIRIENAVSEVVKVVPSLIDGRD